MSSTEANQQSLIERAKAGDSGALELLLITYSDQLTEHIAVRLPASLRSKVSVEDVTQEALTQVFLKIGLLRDTSPKSFVAWLKAIGEFTLMGIVKAERRKKRGGEFRRVGHVQDSDTDSLVDLVAQLPGEDTTASRVMARHEAIAAIRVGIAGLAADQRRAVQLHFVQGKTLDETAEAMNKTPAAIRSLLHRAKQNLAEAMGRASMWLSQR